MPQIIRIMVPIFPTSGLYFFRGYVFVSNHQQIIIYITEYATNIKDITNDNESNDDYIFGSCDDGSSGKSYFESNINGNNILILKNLNKLRVNKLRLNGRNMLDTDNLIVIRYDYEKFKNSETITDSSDYFMKLQVLLKCDSEGSSYEPILRSSQWLASSMFALHLINYINLINWLLTTMRQQRKISIKPGNLILAIVTDIILGYFLMELLYQNKKSLSMMLLGILETLVNLLYSLLKWLMGAPAGLKLNNAFNKMLGKYFLYHIQLWWLFLDVSGEKLDLILQIYHYMGYLGFTFQAAIISDMISIATFHSYCIYVYAARLFNIQIAGLIALLRLFVGKKYNPLRGGIDSCEYTNQELFVGTVAFTILLLLLPTTTMYYIVFTLFRLLSLGVQYILARSIYFVQTLPMYVVPLWIMKSPRVAGNILLEVDNKDEDSPLVLKVKLFNKPLQELVAMFKPPAQSPKEFNWSNLLSNIFVGKQII